MKLAKFLNTCKYCKFGRGKTAFVAMHQELVNLLLFSRMIRKLCILQQPRPFQKTKMGQQSWPIWPGLLTQTQRALLFGSTILANLARIVDPKKRVLGFYKKQRSLQKLSTQCVLLFLLSSPFYLFPPLFFLLLSPGKGLPTPVLFLSSSVRNWQTGHVTASSGMQRAEPTELQRSFDPAPLLLGVRSPWVCKFP